MTLPGRLRKFGFVSVHVPKTGGQTLMRTLERRFDDQLFYDHNFDFLPVPDRKERMRYLAADLRGGDRCVHGHFPATKHWHPRAVMFAFVRDPFERRVSVWSYIRREFDDLVKRRGEGFTPGPQWQMAKRMELEEFVDQHDGCYTRFLDMPLDRFAWIGSMAEYDRDMERLAELIGTEYVAEKVNAAPKKARTADDDALRRIFAARNPNEFKLYEAALERREAILASDRFGAGRVAV